MQTDHSLVKKGENDLAGVMRALAEKIAVHAPSRGTTAVGVYPALAMHRYEGCIDRQRYVQEPAVCLVVQGRQQVMLNQEDYTFASAQYLLSSVALPVTARILEAAHEQPCLGLSLGLDYQQLPPSCWVPACSPLPPLDRLRGLSASADLTSLLRRRFCVYSTCLISPKTFRCLPLFCNGKFSIGC